MIPSTPASQAEGSSGFGRNKEHQPRPLIHTNPEPSRINAYNSERTVNGLTFFREHGEILGLSPRVPTPFPVLLFASPDHGDPPRRVPSVFRVWRGQTRHHSLCTMRRFRRLCNADAR